ncbi:GNAT family N-acetyltransferase [Cryptosporangium arvum]|uniref:GNAT family N-acetyltransferase n=1 Tax=Cryptosporangium arvum TaxID=80871 RepID=UPI0004BB266E|nr:GNAT family N-acetyltransferase [Cryptosporangium arvum]
MGINVQSFAVTNLRRRPVALEVAGFVVGLEPTDPSPFLNYATPWPGTRPTPGDVAALITAFTERGLRPRLEFAPDAAPDVEPALRRAGFTTEAEHQYLACTPDTLALPPGHPGETPGHHVETPRTDEEFAAIDATLSEAFGGAFASSPAGAARLRRQQERGGFVRFVRAPDGTCAGAAGCSAPAEGTAELAGVGTRPEYRGRGIAASVTAALTEAAFGAGADSVWLEYGGEGSRRVYERVGYRVAGRRLYLSLV